MREISYEINYEDYVSPSSFRLEMSNLFLGSWVFFAHEDELDRPGSTMAERLLGASVVVRRGRDGRLRAFRNICQHRAGPLLWDGQNDRGPLRCRYHGWTYDDDGQLISTPGFYGTTRKTSLPGQYRLLSLRVESWNRLVFINFDADAQPLMNSFGELPVLLEDSGVHALKSRAKKRFIFECNWKLYVENWLESYHIPWLHRELSKDVQLTDYSVSVRNGVVVHTAPPTDARSIYNGLWVWVPPATSWNLYPGGLSVERIQPLGPDSTCIDYTFLFEEGVPQSVVASTLQMCETVTNEDGRACEAVQVNLSQGLFQRGPLSPVHEVGVAHLHSILFPHRPAQSVDLLNVDESQRVSSHHNIR